jgi:hypothetical protein
VVEVVTHVYLWDSLCAGVRFLITQIERDACGKFIETIEQIAEKLADDIQVVWFGDAIEREIAFAIEA